MPFAIDEDKMKPSEGQIVTLDPSKPPMKSIPHQDFPRLVYKHPTEPFRKVEHRNAMREITQVELVPTEHIYKSVADAKELAHALKEGWVKEPYIQTAPPDPNANLYNSASE